MPFLYIKSRRQLRCQRRRESMGFSTHSWRQCQKNRSEDAPCRIEVSRPLHEVMTLSAHTHTHTHTHTRTHDQDSVFFRCICCLSPGISETFCRSWIYLSTLLRGACQTLSCRPEQCFWTSGWGNSFVHMELVSAMIHAPPPVQHLELAVDAKGAHD